MPKTGKNSKGSVFKKKTSSSGSNGDFAKKKAKVGKKVERSTVTKISVQSKQIHVPVQSQITAASPRDERCALEKILKQLQHYSGSNRTQALTDLNNFVLGSEHAESYSSIIIPQAMELLFDDEADTREALLVLMSTITLNIRSQSIKAVMSVLVTYICSGLTSLNKGVRKDSLLLLCQVAETHPELMPPFSDKVLRNILGLLSKASLIFNSSSSQSGPTPPSSSTSTGIVRSKDKGDSKKTKANLTGSDSTNSNLLLLLLHVIRLVLTSAATGNQSTLALMPTSSEAVEKIDQIRKGKLALLSPYQEKNQKRVAQPAAPLRRTPMFYSMDPSASHSQGEAERKKASLLGPSGDILDHDGDRHLPMESESALCDQLRTTWTRLSLAESLLKSAVVRSLTEAASIMLHLANRPGIVRSGYFLSVLKTALSHFPYVAAETQVASSNSVLVEDCSRAAHGLNLILCRTALSTVSDMGRAPTDSDVELTTLVSEVSSYLLTTLDDLCARFRDRADAIAGTSLEFSEGKMQVDEDGDGDGQGNFISPEESAQNISKINQDPVEENTGAGVSGNHFTQKGRVYSIEALSHRRTESNEGDAARLFTCLQVLALHPVVWQWATPVVPLSFSEAALAPTANDNSNTVLEKLARLNVALRDCPRGKAGRQHSQKDLRLIVSASVACLSQMCLHCDKVILPVSTAAAESESVRDNTIHGLKEVSETSLNLSQTLLPMPALLGLVGWREDIREKSVDLFLSAVLAVTRRLPSSHHLVTSVHGGGTSVPFHDEKDIIRSITEPEASAAPSRLWSEEMKGQQLALLKMTAYLYLSRTDEQGHTDIGGGTGTAINFYSRCDHAQRMILLDIFAQAPFEAKDLSSVTAALAAHVVAPPSAASVPWTETRGFLRALLKRRMDMTPAALVSVLFQMLSSECARVKDTAHDDEIAALQACVTTSSRGAMRVSTEVSTTLLAISTVTAPHKIITFLKTRLLKLAALSDAAIGAGPYAEAPLASKQIWLRTHYNHCAFAEICLQLVPPCLKAFARQGDDSDFVDVSAMDTEEMDQAKHALATVLAGIASAAVSKSTQGTLTFSEAAIKAALTNPKSEASGASANFAVVTRSNMPIEALLINPFVRLLTVAIPGAAVVPAFVDKLGDLGISLDPIPNMTSSLIADFPLLEIYLRSLLYAWKASGDASSRLVLVHSLALFLRHEGFQDTAVKCKGFLKAYVSHLISYVSASVAVAATEDEAESIAGHTVVLVLEDIGRSLV